VLFFLEDVKYTGFLWNDVSNGYYFCPNCNYILIEDYPVYDKDIQHKKFCENCGTKINWSNRNLVSSYVDKVKFLSEKLSISESSIIDGLEMYTLDNFMDKFLHLDNKEDIDDIRSDLIKSIHSTTIQRHN
jgi:hypothetical protein